MDFCEENPHLSIRNHTKSNKEKYQFHGKTVINNRMPKSACISMMINYNTTGDRMSKPDITKSFQKHGVEALKIKGVDYYIIKQKEEEIPEAEQEEIPQARLLGAPPM